MPPRNVYFSHGTRSEQNLLEDLIIEAMSIYGHDVYYIPRKIVNLDTILNEDVISKFEKSFKVEMYVESVDGFEGDGKLIAKFGLEIRDQITLVVARRRWNSLVGRFGYTQDSVRPREGDLIFFPMTRGLFEIKFVEDKKPFFQLNNTPTFKLICELFEYGGQDIDTGIDVVDLTQKQTSQTHRTVVTFADSAVIPVNEYANILLPSGITGSAKVLAYEIDGDTTILSFGALTFNDGQFHTLTADTVLTGQTSGIVATVVSVIGLSDSDAVLFENDAAAQNSAFETIGNSFIDFSVANPFGEPFV
jgi:hypothetical protein